MSVSAVGLLGTIPRSMSHLKSSASIRASLVNQFQTFEVPRLACRKMGSADIIFIASSSSSVLNAKSTRSPEYDVSTATNRFQFCCPVDRMCIMACRSVRSTFGK